MTTRSLCPISKLLDCIGDKWSLLIIRDLLFFKKQTFSDLLNSEEKVATNILTSRLDHLEKTGFITKRIHPNDKRKKIYSLTPMSIDLVPVIMEMIIWSSKYHPALNLPTSLIENWINDRQNVLDTLQPKKL